MKKMRPMMYESLGFVCALAAAAVLQAEEGGLKSGGAGRLAQERKVLLVGDSLMASLGPQLREELSRYKKLTLIPIGKPSSGLARPDFYNWPRVLEEHLRRERPQVVVMWVGTNDTQSIYEMPSAGEVGSKTWLAAYRGKIAEVVRLSMKHGARFILMGPPMVSNEKMDAKLAVINKFMKLVCQRAKIPYIDTRAVLSNAAGRYCSQGRMSDGSLVPIRMPDGVHITKEGNRIVIKRLLPVLSRMVIGYAPGSGNRGINGRGSVRVAVGRGSGYRSYRGETSNSSRRH